ncbi:MAG: hypothetical protein QNK37_09125 [Acidobacteriota bacterium]|nr:hypothetical protein [Acidobacteriota bacterium]
MTPTCWLDWCTKQTADLSNRLMIQGYDPARIEFLRATNAEFRARFERFENAIDTVAEAMTRQPEGYHHYETLTRAKQELLLYTCEERGRLTAFEPAMSA